MNALAARRPRHWLPRALTATASGRAGIAIVAVLLCALVAGPALRQDVNRIQIERKLEAPSLAEPPIPTVATSSPAPSTVAADRSGPPSWCSRPS
jgi:hypothetical protein